MAQSAFLFMATFLVTLALAQPAGGSDVHVDDVYPAIAFFAGVVVTVLGWLLKFMLSRDRNAIDAKFVEIQANLKRESDILHKHMEHAEAKTKGYVDGLGVKVDRLAEVLDKKVEQEVEELRRHDEQLFSKFDEMNRTIGSLIGEHKIMVETCKSHAKSNC